MKFTRIALLGFAAVPLVLSGCTTINDWVHPRGSAAQNVPAAPNTSTAVPAPQNPQSAMPQPSASKNSLVIYLSSMQPQPDYIAVQQQGQTVYVDRTNTLLRSDLSNVLAVRDARNNPVLNLQFSPAGKAKLAELTTQNPGKALTITYKGQLVSILNITSPVREGILSVPMPSAEEAGRLEQQILDGD